MAAAADYAEAQLLDTDILRNLLGEWEEIKSKRLNGDKYLAARGIGWVQRKVALLLSLYQTLSISETELLVRTQVGP